MSSQTERPREVVVADMDRTLMTCDLTAESILTFVRRAPLKLPKLFGWYRSGRPIMKEQLALRYMPDISLAPPNPEVVEYLKAKKAEGALIVLASASNENLVQAVADRFGFFDEVYGSSPGNNFKGSGKADGLDEHFGVGGYTYIGDSPADLKVWSRAAKAVSAGVSSGLRRKVEVVAAQAEHLRLASRASGVHLSGVVKLLRPAHWLLNLLLFVPFLLTQTVTPKVMIIVGIGFLAFCLVQSGAKVAYDLLNLDVLRADPEKKHSPLASAVVPVKDGLLLAPLLLLAGLLLSATCLHLLFIPILAVFALLEVLHLRASETGGVQGWLLFGGLTAARLIAGVVAANVIFWH